LEPLNDREERESRANKQQLTCFDANVEGEKGEWD
jgi:hypothetical protein